ncbi:MAG TPA: hypothetical protein VM734_04405 [Kofleriaceae bacterium]|nr:hypothetical protein [Kofleriaceae bacterium]
MTVRPHLRLALLLTLSTLAACEVGAVGPGGGDGSGDDDPIDDPAADVDAAPAPVQSYTLTVSPPTATTVLGTKTTFNVSMSATNFSGPVTVAAGGVPASWQIAITPTTVDLIDGGTAMASVEITIPPNGEAAPDGATLTIEATGAPGNRSGTAMMTVANEYVFSVAAGTANGVHWGAMNGGLVRLKSGTKLVIKNDDTTGHRIHTNGGISGFGHQGATMAPGASYAVTVGDGSDNFYCHDHGQNTGTVNVTVE